MSRALIARSISRVDGDADVLHRGEHTHERVLDRAVELGHPLRFEAGVDRLGDVVHGERVAAGPLGVARPLLPSRSSWPGGGAAVSGGANRVNFSIRSASAYRASAGSMR